MNRFGTSRDRWLRTIEEVILSRRAYLLFSAALVLFVFLGSLDLYSVGAYADYWEHLAFMNSFAKDLAHPRNPYLPESFPIYMHSPYHLFWGGVCRVVGVNALWIAPVIGTANILLFLVAARLFCERILGDGWAALVYVLTLLFFWLDPWPWSGFYNFGVLPLAASYPYWFAFSAALVIISLYPRRDLWLSLLFVPLASMVILAHPITGAFLLTALVVMPAVEAWDRHEPLRLIWIGLPVAAFLLADSWPYSSLSREILAAGQSTQGYNQGYLLFYERLPLRLLLALPGLAYLYVCVRRRRHDFIALGFVALFAMYLANYSLIRSVAAARMIVYVVFFLHCGFTMVIITSGARVRRMLVTAVVVVAIGSSVLQVRQSFHFVGIVQDIVGHTGPGYHSNLRVFRDYRIAFAPFLTRDDIVWARSHDSLMLPVFVECKIVNKQWPPNPYLPPDFSSARAADERLFFSRDTAPATRMDILRRYRATHLLVSQPDTSFLSGMNGAIRLAATARDERLYAVVPARDSS